MVLMAIDHVRVYSGVPAGGRVWSVFLTRWVTHFCAPWFVFLAGTGAFLYGQKLDARRGLAKFLVSRGALLVILELTIIRLSWTYNFDYAKFTLAGVIWMLGWSMILLAALVPLSPKTVGFAGLAMMVAQQIFALPGKFLPTVLARSWEYIYPGGNDAFEALTILYVIVPWVGVMAAGYGFGAILQRDPESRRRLCLAVGLASTALFIALGIFLALGASGQNPPPLWERVLNQQKYPPSQVFLLMTLGPMIALLPFAERAEGAWAGTLALFGRVPMFYYLLHIPLIHFLALVTNLLREGAFHQEWYNSAPYAQVPPDHRWPLALLYLVWAVALAILYALCRWFANVKASGRYPWLRFI